ncbi:hypothetical protein A3F28_01655 [Candidatus Uhrbacteria bacterium RIFCSPHIGHO2_12_FULL_57_11]|uniref:Uncharacterized protein n=3 Tax=Parcubacteria group TaxID=1794811 RepID=A0A1F7UJY1_9BACT|nr:MAG: hypothetical protein A2704_06445 [Candidatus Kaiserbacteria bacterium RIFCSPHIGHO2_01_FULL_54_36b]OGL72448.1 MAG: hypothetical protein A3D72_01225 [Candidatus Uhrbacteria bacterium RIFCSPHIGHO2_02_FULL_57_19]OGL78034.1 MAG: hypothetical protein A3F28_01655 [Candidatus Uhrbacteria bacterium RIFCSPHIGHO2_12_FULL_57_11]
MTEHNDVTTGELMDFLQDHMVMKEDFVLELSKMATKEDLARMVTKEDLNRQKAEILDAMDDKLADLKGDLVILNA